MDDGEVEHLDHRLLRTTNIEASNSSIESYLDELLQNKKTCTHTHTCNPPGPDSTHTHTCYHTHTQFLPVKEHDPISKPQRPLGNREAVRKYREKKKAQTAYLEEEVKKLRLLNEQLMRKLQGQSQLEAEVLRLRSLLVDFRGRIDGELGVVPFQNQKMCNYNGSSLKEGDCGIESMSGVVGLSCETGTPMEAAAGGSGKMVVSCGENCQPKAV